MATNRQIAIDAKRDFKPYIEFTTWLIRTLKAEENGMLQISHILPVSRDVFEEHESLYRQIIDQMLKVTSFT